MRLTLVMMILLLAFAFSLTGCPPSDTGDDTGDDRQPVTGPADVEQPEEPIGGMGAEEGSNGETEEPGEMSAPDSGVMSTIGFPDGWPSEVGVPPGFTITLGTRNTETNYGVSAEGYASAEETGEFYAEIEGWTRLGETNTGGDDMPGPIMKAIRFQKDDRMLDIQIIENEGITKLHIILDRMPGA